MLRNPRIKENVFDRPGDGFFGIVLMQIVSKFAER